MSGCGFAKPARPWAKTRFLKGGCPPYVPASSPQVAPDTVSPKRFADFGREKRSPEGTRRSAQGENTKNAGKNAKCTGKEKYDRAAGRKHETSVKTTSAASPHPHTQKYMNENNILRKHSRAEARHGDKGMALHARFLNGFRPWITCHMVGQSGIAVVSLFRGCTHTGPFGRLDSCGCRIFTCSFPRFGVEPWFLCYMAFRRTSLAEWLCAGASWGQRNEGSWQNQYHSTPSRPSTIGVAKTGFASGGNSSYCFPRHDRPLLSRGRCTCDRVLVRRR